MRFNDKVRSVFAAGLTLLLLGLSTGISAAQVASQSKPREHVYLMRGAFNVFSLGLDELAAKLQRLGINVSVENYLAWSRIVDEAAAEYKSGQVQNIILVGHSSGATAVTAVAARLSELGVPVKLAVGLDPTTRVFATGHVDRYVNFYAPGGMGTVVDKGRDFHGVLQNVSITTAGHFDIDKNQGLHDKVIAGSYRGCRRSGSGRWRRRRGQPPLRNARGGCGHLCNHAFSQDEGNNHPVRVHWLGVSATS
jgi:hypothetical protein